jgi:hypothetical protein
VARQAALGEAWIDEADLAYMEVAARRATSTPIQTQIARAVGPSAFDDDEVLGRRFRNRAMNVRTTPVVCVQSAGPEGLLPGLSAVVGIRKK